MHMDTQTLTKLKNRLHRLEGMLRGIESMADADRDTSEIIQQLWAVRQSITSTVLSLIQDKDMALLLKLIKRL